MRFAHRGPILAAVDSKGGVGTPPFTPKWLYRTMPFAGAQDFVLRIRHGEFFCWTLCVYTQHTQTFVEISQMAEKQIKGF